MRILPKLLALLVFLVPLPAGADGPSPKPGTCAPSATVDGIRKCFPDKGAGVFTVRVAKGATVLIQADEPLLQVQPPEQRLFSFQCVGGTKDEPCVGATAMLIRPKLSAWPETTSAWFRTQTLSITLKFEAVAGADADAQVLIVPFDRREKDAELERRWRAREKVLDELYRKKLAGVAKKAHALARRAMVQQLVAGGAQLRDAGGERRVYHNHITVRSGDRLRMHEERFLEVTVKNEDRNVLRFHPPSAWLERAGQVQRLAAKSVACQTRELGADQMTTCWIGLGRQPLGADQRLTVEIVEVRGNRRARLAGIDVR